MMRNVTEAMGLGWTIQGPALEECDGVNAYVIRVKEFSGFIVAEDSRETALAELFPAMQAWLQSYISSGDQLPTPGSKLEVEILSLATSDQPQVFQDSPETESRSSASDMTFA